MAANLPDMVLGFEDEVWWSREAQLQREAWSDDEPVRLVDKTIPVKDPEGKAMACWGLYVPTVSQLLWHFVGASRQRGYLRLARVAGHIRYDPG
jgi:hypothetical protein